MTNRGTGEIEYGRVPSSFWYTFMATNVCVPLVALLLNIKAKPNKELRKMDGPMIILGNHPSYLDPFVAMRLTKGSKVNFVAGEFLFRSKFWRYAFTKAGMIPKKQFATDPTAVKAMMRVLKRGGKLAIFPEATRFVDGKSVVFDEGVARMAKKCGSSLFFMKSYGAYLTYPRWSESFVRRGKIEARFGRFISSEEVESMSVEELHKVILDEIDYDENDYSRETNQHYHNRHIASGLQNILYACPKCKEEFVMEYKGSDYIECSRCGNRIRYLKNGLLGGMRDDDVAFDDTHKHVEWERDITSSQIDHTDYVLEADCKILKPIDKIDFAHTGNGKLVVTAEKIIYVGSDCNTEDGIYLHKGKPYFVHRKRELDISSNTSYEFEIATMKGLVARLGSYVEVYDKHGQLFRFALDNGQIAFKIHQIVSLRGRNSKI